MSTSTVNQIYPVRLQLSDGNTAQYPRAVVYNSAGTLIATLNLNHIANGLYGVDYTFLNVGFYTITHIVYSDVNHTTLASYDRSFDEVTVVATATNPATTPATANNDSLSMFRGDSFSLLVTAKRKSSTGALEVIDMTGGSAKLTLKKKKSDTANIIQKTGAVQSPGTAGNILFAMVPGDSSAVAPDVYFYDVQATTAGGSVYTVVQGTFEIKYDITTS